MDPTPHLGDDPAATPADGSSTVGAAPERINGGQALIRSLELEGTDTIFGLPGGAILPVYDPILDSPIRHILVRHEQGAGHMAEGYAHATGRPGVAMVTSGPAATNIVTPLADAYMDSVPMICITGQVGTKSLRARCWSTSPRTSSTRTTPTLGSIGSGPPTTRCVRPCPATGRRRLATPVRCARRRK